MSAPEKLRNETGWRILDALQDNARIPFSELGRRVGLSAPAVTERVRRMEDAGLITGYRVELGLEKLGFPIAALIRVAAPEEKCPRIRALIESLADVLECHHVTGDESFLLKVKSANTGSLEKLLGKIRSVEGGTRTVTKVVLSTAKESQVLDLDAGLAGTSHGKKK